MSAVPPPRIIGGIDPSNDPNAASEYVIRSMIDGLDAVAAEMERKWGVGRLRLLVGDLLRLKFDRQADKVDAAIESGREGQISVHLEAMKRAWSILDNAATEAGHQPLAPEVWECTLPKSGETVAIVRTEAEAHHVCRECRVFTLAEVGMLIEALGNTVLQLKQLSPDATITRVKAPPIDWEKGDDIPF